MMHMIPDQRIIASIGQHIMQSETIPNRASLIKIYHRIGCSLTEIYTTTPSAITLKHIIAAVKKEYPTIRGIHVCNVRNMYRFAKEYKIEDVERLRLYEIPWGHHLILLNTVPDRDARLFYIQSIIKYTWSRTTLINNIQTHLYERHTKVITNFSNTLPRSFAQQAQTFFKHTYFFAVTEVPTTERELEDALLIDVTNFLKELGPGFAFIGRQYHINTNEEDCYIDLLLYNIHLKSYLVIELKNGPFKSEYVGKMHLYIQAVDTLLKNNHDNQTIGLILCKSSSSTGIATLQDAGKPLAIGEYRIKPIYVKQKRQTHQISNWSCAKYSFHRICLAISCIIMCTIIIVGLFCYVPLPHGSRCSGSSSSSSDSSSFQESSSSSNDNPSCSKL